MASPCVRPISYLVSVTEQPGPAEGSAPLDGAIGGHHSPREEAAPSQLRVEAMGTGSAGLRVMEIKSKGRQRSHEFDFEGACISPTSEAGVAATTVTQRQAPMQPMMKEDLSLHVESRGHR